MLKLNKNITPTGIIDGANTIYVLPNYIGYIQEVIVDGGAISAFTFEHDTITLTVAPTASINISFFSREERDITGNGEVTMGDLIDEVYEEIGRKQLSKIYPKERIRRELNQTIGDILDVVPERSNIQHYSFFGLNGLTVEKDKNTVNITRVESYPLDIEGSFLVGDGIYYNYFAYDGVKFDVAGNDLIEDFDKLLVGHRIPTGVERVSEVYVDGIKLDYIDNRDFDIYTYGKFTTIKDYQGNEYLYLPFSSDEYTCVVKFIPDYAISSVDEDVIDIKFTYKRVLVYDVTYRILASREDDRWQFYERQFEKELKKYKAFKSKAVRKTKSKIGFASTYDNRSERRIVNAIPDGVYDQYL